MYPLQTNHRVLVWLSMCPPDKTTTAWKRFAYITSTVVCIILINFSIWPSLFYLLKYLSIDLESCLYALFQLVLCASMFYACILFLTKNRLEIIFINLAKIYRKSKHCIPIKSSSSIQSPWIFR